MTRSIYKLRLALSVFLPVLHKLSHGLCQPTAAGEKMWEEPNLQKAKWLHFCPIRKHAAFAAVIILSSTPLPGKWGGYGRTASLWAPAVGGGERSGRQAAVSLW